VFTVVLVTDVLLQLDHISGTTYLPVCETRKSAAQSSEDNWKHSCFRRTAAHRDFWLLRLINTLTYLLVYLVIRLPGSWIHGDAIALLEQSAWGCDTQCVWWCRSNVHGWCVECYDEYISETCRIREWMDVQTIHLHNCTQLNWFISSC